MKVAVVHDWLVTYAGAERVLQQILLCFPEADLFSVCDFIAPDQREFLLNKPARTTFIQKLPFAKTKYRQYLPLMPLAIEQLDLSAYDIIISSSHAVAKGVLVGPDQLHISYIHSPIRYAWDLQHQYLAQSGMEKGLKGWVARYLLHRIRKWDVRTANSIDLLVANSHFIARRVQKIYRREARVVYPPVAVEDFSLQDKKSDFYLTAARMVPYKKTDLLVEAFAKLPDKKLVVIGEGPDSKKIRKKAASNITFLGYQPAEILKDYLERAKAFVYAAEEDFGIVLAEALASGTPVITYGKGGALEIVRGLETNQPTGVFFKEQTVAGLLKGIQDFEASADKIRSDHCRRSVQGLSRIRFRREFKDLVLGQWEKFKDQGVRRPGEDSLDLPIVAIN